MIHNLCKSVRSDNRTFQASTTTYFVVYIIDLKCSVYIWYPVEVNKRRNSSPILNTTRHFNFEVYTSTEVTSVSSNRSVKYSRLNFIFQYFMCMRKYNYTCMYIYCLSVLSSQLRSWMKRKANVKRNGRFRFINFSAFTKACFICSAISVTIITYPGGYLTHKLSSIFVEFTVHQNFVERIYRTSISTYDFNVIF